MTNAFPAEWAIGDAALVSDGIGGTVWRVELEGRTAIAKRASPLALPELPHALAYLGWRAGDGAARLLDHRGEWVLLEDAGDLHLLDRLGEIGDDEATRIAACLLGRLHAPSSVPPPPDLMPLRVHFASLFQLAQGSPPEPIFRRAADVAERLLSSAPLQVPLHGDFHHENMLDGPRGWLVIDPKGLIGDPAYDAANLFYNPLESAARACSSRALRMAGILSAVLGHAPKRLLGYGFAHACLSAAWHTEDGNNMEAGRSLDVARAVEAALNQVT